MVFSCFIIQQIIYKKSLVFSNCVSKLKLISSLNYMAYKKSSFSKVSKRSSKVSKKVMTPRTATKVIKNYVKSEIARNVENKKTLSYNLSTDNNICIMNTSVSQPDWFLQKDWNVKLFTISQGPSVQQRNGNSIKLKKWIIQGQIAPTISTQSSAQMSNTLCGHVDIYFGRLNNNGEISNSLPNFLDNGSTSLAPLGAQNQIFKPVNTDEYKIYWHKRYKMSPSQNQITPAGNATVLSNNGFSLVRTFKFDVCNYICKNATIKYNDNDNDANNDMIRRLALWATWTPAIGDMLPAPFTPATHFYKINLESNAEYEDA